MDTGSHGIDLVVGALVTISLALQGWSLNKIVELIAKVAKLEILIKNGRA